MIPTKFFIILMLFFLPVIVNAQSIGFGCLGFVGGYGGFTYQQYDPKGLNNYIQYFNTFHTDSLSSPMNKFGKAEGYRFGINFFRAELKGFVITTKGFYQHLSEDNQTSFNKLSSNSSANYQLDLVNWGLGLDLGVSITKGLSWKVIDAAFTYNTATFTNTINLPGPTTIIKKYENESPEVGYSIGTGFILSLIDQYASIEGYVGYSQITINKMKSDTGSDLTVNENSNQVMTNFISGGGISTTVQLNVGFPL